MTDIIESRGEHRTRDGGGDGGKAVPGMPLTSGASPTRGGPAPSGDLWDPAVIFHAGQTVAGRFIIRKAIGRGGMGAVYAADDSLTKMSVALKAILPSLVSIPRVRDRFIEEVNIARGLHHPRIVTVFDLISYEGGIFYTMELLRGHTVRAFMRHHGRLALEVCVRILNDICDALEYAHQFTVHRDISPENIMLLQDRTVKLLDFGIAKPVEMEVHLKTKGAMGKDYYMAPEQRRNAGNVDLRADIWSLGVTLFEMLTAEMPMGYDSVRTLRPDLPKSCEQLIQRAIAPLEERYASAREFREDLRACVRGAGMDPGDTGQKKTGRRLTLTRRQMIWAGVAALPVVMGVAGVPFLFLRNSMMAETSPVADAPSPENAVTSAVKTAPTQGTPNFAGYWKGGEFAELFFDNAGPTSTGWVRSFQNPGEKYPFTTGLQALGEKSQVVLTAALAKPYSYITVSDSRSVDRFKVEFSPDGTSGLVTVGFHKDRWPEESFSIFLTRPRGTEEYIEFADLKLVETYNGHMTRAGGFAGGSAGAYITFELPISRKGLRSVALSIQSRRSVTSFQMYFDGTLFAVITDDAVQPYRENNEIGSDYIYPVPIGQFDFSKDKYLVSFQLIDNGAGIGLDQLILY